MITYEVELFFDIAAKVFHEILSFRLKMFFKGRSFDKNVYICILIILEL